MAIGGRTQETPMKQGFFFCESDIISIEGLSFALVEALDSKLCSLLH